MKKSIVKSKCDFSFLIWSPPYKKLYKSVEHNIMAREVKVRENEIIAIVMLFLLIISIPSFLIFTNSMSNSIKTQNIDSAMESTADFTVEYVEGEIIGTVILVIVSFIVSILVLLGVVKKGR